MIAAPVVPHREIDQLAAKARRPGIARQFAQLAGHFLVLVAIGERRRVSLTATSIRGTNGPRADAITGLSLQWLANTLSLIEQPRA